MSAIKSSGVIHALPDKKPQISVTKEGLAIVVIVFALLFVGIGGALMWNIGAGLLAVGVLLFVVGVLLALG